MSEETKMILQAIQEMKEELHTEIQEMRKEMQTGFDKVDEHLKFLGEKWMEHDLDIRKLKKKA